jgi:ABC-type multidrug transport system fused ATPase/permease subunit
MKFHDHPDHSPGKLTSTLEVYASKMAHLSGTNLGVIAQAFTSLAVGLTLAFIASPKLTAVLLATLPLLGLAGVAEMSVYVGVNQNDSMQEATRSAQVVVSEVIQNMRTVRAAGAEQFALEQYASSLRKPLSLAAKQGVLGALAFGMSQCLYFFVYALGFWYGGKLVSDDGLEFDKVFQAMMCVIMGGAGMGQAMAFMPNVAEAKAAAHDVFKLLDTPIGIDALSTTGKMVPYFRTIEFKNVNFSYPQRPDVKVLTDLSFTVNAGQKVAFVGPSGGGKSTVVQLLERFYDINSGSVNIDGNDLKELRLSDWRSQIGYVGQEPVLFNMTLEENIKYGCSNATEEDLQNVIVQANVSDFILKTSPGSSQNDSSASIENLQRGVRLDESLGPKGGRLSGGQKQRVAIGRALIRRPQILVLDEATSALDSQSEKKVQSAIDNIDLPVTTIIVAHRLTTIQDADKIFVVSQGKVVEQGTHEELMKSQSTKSVYRDLYFHGQS